MTSKVVQIEDFSEILNLVWKKYRIILIGWLYSSSLFFITLRKNSVSLRFRETSWFYCIWSPIKFSSLFFISISNFLSSQIKSRRWWRTWKHVARGRDIKTITWCIYLLLDSNASKSGLSFQINLEALAQNPWIWWTDDAEIMKSSGDKLMMILKVLHPTT